MLRYHVLHGELMKCIQMKVPNLGVGPASSIVRVSDTLAQSLVQRGHAAYIKKEAWKLAGRLTLNSGK